MNPGASQSEGTGPQQQIWGRTSVQGKTDGGARAHWLAVALYGWPPCKEASKRMEKAVQFDISFKGV